MIIRQIGLNPFAGISERTLDLDPGLNIILGPNEAGKSTFVNAIHVALFQSTSQTKKKLETNIGSYLPDDGGDIIQLFMRFSVGNEDYSLKKSFGGSPDLCNSELIAGNGNPISDANTVSEKLEELCQFSSATWKNVLICDQRAILDTLKTVKTDELTDNLRTAVMHTGGVSIEKLRKNIKDLLESYVSNWDLEINAPRKNRTVQRSNEWKQMVGDILKSFYNKERLEIMREEQDHYERSLDECNQTISQLTLKVKELDNFLNKNKNKYDAVKELSGLRSQLEIEDGRFCTLRQVHTEWGNAEEKLKRLIGELPSLRDTANKLKQEQQYATGYNETRRAIDQLADALKAQTNLDKAQLNLSRIPKLVESDITEINELTKACDNATASLEASKFSVTLTAKNDWEGVVQGGLNVPEEKIASAGETIAFQADGQVMIENEDFSLLVKSSGIDVEVIKRQFEMDKGTLKIRLNQLGFEDEKKAKQGLENYNTATRSVKGAQALLKSCLKDTTIEALEQTVKDVQVDEEPRPVDTINEELNNANGEVLSKEQERDILKKKINEWENDYETVEKLFEAIVTQKIKANELQTNVDDQEIQTKGEQDPNGFIARYEKTRDELGQEKDALGEARIELSELGDPKSELSVAELNADITDKTLEFERTKEKHDALLAIQRAVEEICNSPSEEPLSSWKEDVRSAIGKMSAGMYEDVSLGNRVATQASGQELASRLLSTGTHAMLGFALRLSMAEHFLRNRADGFIIFDDPMVDIDPERREAIAKVINAYATKRQIVYLTCHPSHADVLNGKLQKWERIRKENYS